ncbi:MAG TPA: glycosyl hydrolase [Chitinophagaceae bacterium]|nr:glycosyl hydrolase [Chitinophagaceae bacterium]
MSLLLVSHFAFSQPNTGNTIIRSFFNPPASAKPWVFWYWMHAAISREGISADLEAMKEAGIGGAYLMPIKDSSATIPFQPIARQLTPEWWSLVAFAMQEARRLDLKLAMHVSDGFALAGGPWISPELSMQKLVWNKTYIKGGRRVKLFLPRPETKLDYYKEIAIIAYRANSQHAFNDVTLVPSVSTSIGTRASFLSFPQEGNENFRSDSSCWIQYKYPEPFTCRSIKVHTGGNNYQAHRMIVQAGDDGKNFKTIARLEPPRHGWQDTDEDVTHAIPSTTAKYFRFVYDKEGSLPGSEDLDAAKWKPSFKVMGIYLSDEPLLHQYESKNGSIWRVSKSTEKSQVPDSLAIPLTSIINISSYVNSEAYLEWNVPEGNWVIARIGHSSTGHSNATGGAGKGLECDKFNPKAIRLQFENWFAQAFEKTPPGLAKEVLKIFHVDSWECGSQNWSENFPAEFRTRRGYDPMPYILAMTGVPVESVTSSEKFLRDTRKTIAELIHDIFYTELKKLAAEKDCRFSAESVAPTMVSDGLLHYKAVDLPMGEFWINSPTHDKPNDMLDAISGAHIYGKNIVQAEAFTSVRMNWAEYPGNLKHIGDRNFALGINKMVLHVFTHNPWLDKKPGMTLDGVGLYFQRDQTWFKQSRAWMDYMTRCQALLQQGKPVVDIAVFTGEEIPSRSLLPDRLVHTLPGIFGKEKVEAEKKRLSNQGQPLRSIPDGVSHSANMADPEDWIDPLNGYAYDSFNPDVLMRMTVKNGRVLIPGGPSYAMLVFPGNHPLHPDNSSISAAGIQKLQELWRKGATILVAKDYLESRNGQDKKVRQLLAGFKGKLKARGKLISAPFTGENFNHAGLQKDLELINGRNELAWTHRSTGDAEIYFIANQKNQAKKYEIMLRVKDKALKVLDPVTGKERFDYYTRPEGNRTLVAINLDSYESLFLVFSGKLNPKKMIPFLMPGSASLSVSSPWKLQFDPLMGGPRNAVTLSSLKSWTAFSDSAIQYYSGTVTYSNSLELTALQPGKRWWIKLDSVYNIATVKINSKDCGTIWTAPYELEITSALKPGTNLVEIQVSNTWHNRLIGDQLLPPAKRISWTTAPFRLKGKPLLPAGLVGEVRVVSREL